jgi:hypothetical protein
MLHDRSAARVDALKWRGFRRAGRLDSSPLQPFPIPICYLHELQHFTSATPAPLRPKDYLFHA